MKPPLLVGLTTIAFFIALTIAGSVNAATSSTTTNVTITNSAPVVGALNVNLTTPVTLTSCSTKIITCNLNYTDANGWANVSAGDGRFYTGNSTWASADNNQTHYTNSTCLITGSGTAGTVACNFSIWYWARNSTDWNCTVRLTDNSTYINSSKISITISGLVSPGLSETPVLWNSTASGVHNFAAQSGAGNPLNVSNCGNVADYVWVKGSDLTGSINVADVIGVGNITHDDDVALDEVSENLSAQANLTKSWVNVTPYTQTYLDTYPTGNNQTKIYNWINIPSGVPAQAYNGTYSVCVETVLTAACST